MCWSLEQCVLLHCTEFLEVIQKINPFQLPMPGPSPVNANISLTDTIKGRVLGRPSCLQWPEKWFLRFEMGWKFPLQVTQNMELLLSWTITSSDEKLKQILDNSLFHAFSCNIRSRNINIGSRSWHRLMCFVSNDLVFPCLYPSICISYKFAHSREYSNRMLLIKMLCTYVYTLLIWY